MRKIRTGIYWFGIMIGISLLVWQLLEVVKTVRSNQLAVLSPGYLAAACFSLILLIYLQMLNWQQILHGLGSRLAMFELLRGYTLSLIPRYIPGSIWGFISRGEWLHQSFRVPYNVVTFSSVLEVLVTVVSSIMVIGFFFGVSNWMAAENRAYFLPLVLLLPILVWLLMDRFAHLPFKWKRENTQVRFAIKNIPIRYWLGCILIYLVQWVVLGVSILLVNAAFYPDTAGLLFFTPWNLNVATYAFSFAWLVGFAILFVPGGIGIRELILSSLIFSNLQIPFSQAVMIALFSRGLYFLAEIFWIALGLIIDMAVKRQRQA